MCYNISIQTRKEVNAMERIPVRSYSSKEIIKIIEADGWRHKNTEGDHYQFTHDTKKGKVTITHPVKNLPKKRVKSILTQAGLR